MRMALVPVFIACYFFAYEGYVSRLVSSAALDMAAVTRAAALATSALAVFAAAALTDALDGQIARKRGLVTNFGKLMDPLADKVLTCAAFVCFVDTGRMAAWMLIVILAREFAITGLRSVAASEGVVIAAGMSGKLKTVLQMASVLFVLLGFIFEIAALGGNIIFSNLCGAFSMIGTVALYAAVAATIWSGAEYLWKGRKLLNMR
jgi:CDP-diacylglycerol--glycerol-3-phosphate 3-phosphatidyltransferase